MDTKPRKDFSVAFLLRDNNNNDCDYTYTTNGNSSLKSSCSLSNWNSTPLINNLNNSTPTTNSSSYRLSGRLNSTKEK